MGERRIPETLEEAYRLRDTADSLQERDFYQEQVYHLRREEYRSRGIRTEISSRRRERQSAIEFSREMFFLEVAEISRHGPGAREARAAQHEARRYATRLDTHAFLKQLASPHSGAVELYRRNYLELLRMGKSPSEAYYLSRVIGLAGEGEFRRAAPERARDRLSGPRRRSLRGGAGGDPDKGLARGHDPDPSHLLRLPVRLRVGYPDLG